MKKYKVTLALMVLVLITGLGSKLLADVTMGDDEWIGLAADGGRIVFDDQAIDELSILDASVNIGSTDPPATALEITGGYAYAHQGFKTARSETGYWARGLHVHADASLQTELAGFGAYGSAGAAPTRMYMTMGDNPWSSNLGITIDSDGDVGIGDLTPSYDLDVTGDIHATDDLIVGDDAFISGHLQGYEYANFDEHVTASRHESGLNADQLAAVDDMPYAAVTTNKGGHFTYIETISSDVDLTGLYIANTQTERQAWVRWLVYDITAGTRHDGEATLVFTGTTTSVVIADEGANDLLFKVAEGLDPNNDGYLCLDVVGNHSYEVVLTTLWQ